MRMVFLFIKLSSYLKCFKELENKILLGKQKKYLLCKMKKFVLSRV